MVSKGNNNRKKSIKTEKPKEKAEIPVDNIVNTITQTVVGVLKPDLDKKIESINQSINQIGENLKNQLQNELKDIRSQIPQPQTQPSDQEKAEILSQQDEPLAQQQQMPMVMGIPLELIIKAGLQFLAPKPADNSAMLNTFQQAQIRKGMSEMSYDDWFMKEMRKKMAQEYLHKEIPKEVQAADSEYMKPLRSVGENAVKRDELERKMHQNSNMHQQSEEKHEL